MSLKDAIARIRSANADEGNTERVDVSSWVTALDGLYADVASWLAEYVRDGDLTIERHPLKLEEDGTRPYSVELVDVAVAGEIVRLEPRGMFVVGARGRLDMYRLGSTANPIVVLLLEREHTLIWHLFDRNGRPKFEMLARETFENAFEKLLEEFEPRSKPGLS